MADSSKRKDIEPKKAQAMRKEAIACDPEEARAMMEQRYYRFEALSGHIERGIREGITEHNKHESTIPLPPASPAEVSASLADAVVQTLNWNKDDIDHLYDLMLRRLDPEDELEWL